MSQDLQEFAAKDDTQTALRKALRQLDAAKKRQASLIEAVRDATHDAVTALVIPPIPKLPKVPKVTKRGTAEVAVVELSDWQLAKVTPSYNSVVCEERVEALAEKVIALTEIQRHDHPVDELHVHALGDMIEGELIFPGQAHAIDASLFQQTHIDGPRIFGNFLRRMAGTFKRVHVKTVIGNHGAIGGPLRKQMRPESNGDAMLYEVTRLVTKDEPRIVWGSTWERDTSHWFEFDEVGSKRFLLLHGNQVRGHAGFPWYGFGKRTGGLYMAFERIWNRGGFDYMMHGHFHTPNRMYLNGITVWGNGSTESHNPYALEELGAAGEPCQWLLFVHPEQGVTAEYLVRL